MTAILPWLLGVAMLGAIGLLIGGIAMLRRGDRLKGGLMIATGLFTFLSVNNLATIPMQG